MITRLRLHTLNRQITLVGEGSGSPAAIYSVQFPDVVIRGVCAGLVTFRLVGSGYIRLSGTSETEATSLNLTFGSRPIGVGSIPLSHPVAGTYLRLACHYHLRTAFARARAHTHTRARAHTHTHTHTPQCLARSLSRAKSSMSSSLPAPLRSTLRCVTASGHGGLSCSCALHCQPRPRCCVLQWRWAAARQAVIVMSCGKISSGSCEHLQLLTQRTQREW
jgi:hypothetical protein